MTSLAIMGTPGPATISLTAAGSAYGVRRSLSYLVGIIAGTTAVLLAVATGITAALLALPAVRPALLAAGAAYIVWLAYHIATAPPLAADGSRSDAPGLVGGALLGVANPKAWIAIAAVFASARLADGAAARRRCQGRGAGRDDRRHQHHVARGRARRLRRYSATPGAPVSSTAASPACSSPPPR